MSSKGWKDRLDRWTTSLWGAGFGWMGWWQRPSVHHWHPVKNQRVLVVAPHPDDEIMGCGGTLLHHQASQNPICLVVVTDGGRSRALGLSRTEMVKRRQAEASQVARMLSVDQFHWCGLPEGEWTTEALQTSLQPIITQFSPDLLYLPSLVDFHSEHQQTAVALQSLLPHETTIRVYQVQVPLTAVLTNVVVDVTQYLERIRTLLDAYETQQDTIGNAMRLRRYTGSYYAAGVYAEPFWQMTAIQYQKLHQSNLDRVSTAPFRGIRYRAFTDPLAYTQGRQMRQHLVRQLADKK